MKWLKALVALLLAGLTVAASAVSDGVIGNDEKLQIAIAFVTAAGVYVAPNVGFAPAVKATVAVLLAVLNLATTLITDGITQAELVNLVIAALTALAVYLVPNRQDTDPGPPVVNAPGL